MTRIQRALVWVIGYFAVFVSVVLAVRFAYASADTLIDGMIRAGAAGVAALVGCHGPAWIFRSLRVRAWGTALLLTVGFAICLAVTLVGGIGTIAGSTDKSLSARASAVAINSEHRKELERTQQQRSALPVSRPAGTIEADLAAARVDRRWTSSSACTNVTMSASRTFCADYARLQGELATAKEAASLSEKIGDLGRKLENTPLVRSVNPQATVVARVLHVSIEDAEAWYAFLFALSVGEIEAAINGILSRGVSVGERLRGTIGSLSFNCAKIDVRTQEACAQIATLRQELAVATEAQRLDARVSILKEQIVNLREHGGSIAADPVGEFYAWITGGYVSVRDVGFGFPLAFALLIEIVSAFGPLTIAGYADATRRLAAGRVGPEPDTTRHDRSRPALTDRGGDVAAVLSWIAERATPTNENRALDVDELHHDFVAWSSEEAMLLDRFQRAFDRARDVPELAGKIRKFGDRYYGIGLTATNQKASRIKADE